MYLWNWRSITFEREGFLNPAGLNSPFQMSWQNTIAEVLHLFEWVICSI
jgi:hypothetical protein